MMGMWTDPGFTKRGRGMMGVMGSITTWLGVIFVLLGVIGQAIDSNIGFEPIFWLVLGVASFLFSLGCWLGWAVGIYLHVLEDKSKKE
jgi:protein-S-isoprenylcysteine O-methyltransferase Ste14